MIIKSVELFNGEHDLQKPNYIYSNFIKKLRAYKLSGYFYLYQGQNYNTPVGPIYQAQSHLDIRRRSIRLLCL